MLVIQRGSIYIYWMEFSTTRLRLSCWYGTGRGALCQRERVVRLKPGHVWECMEVTHPENATPLEDCTIVHPLVSTRSFMKLNTYSLHIYVYTVKIYTYISSHGCLFVCLFVFIHSLQYQFNNFSLYKKQS